jgi:hypothetical protein
MKTLLALFAVTLAITVRGEPAGLRSAQTISLSGVSGRFDHFAVDIQGHRIFVAALGNDTVEVLDVAQGKRLHTLKGLHKPQGVAYLSRQNQIIVASGGDGTVKFFNGTSYALENTISNLDDADNVRVDATEAAVYVGYGDGAIALIDPATGKLTGNVQLAAHPESFQLEKDGNRIFVNLPDAAQIAVIDRKSKTVVATWPMTESRANFPMALDETHHRLLVGCRRPARLVVLDTGSGRRMADLEIVGDTDDVFYDAKRKCIYISGGDGYLDLVRQESADTYKLHDRMPTAAGARTAFFSPESAEVYVAVPLRGKQTAEIRTYKAE